MKQSKSTSVQSRKGNSALVSDHDHRSDAPEVVTGAIAPKPATSIGFNGYPLDHTTGCYIMGNGYRLYNPAMRAFYSPDSLSPFGAAGISRYQYCNLDPVNYTDPSGHLAGQIIGAFALISLGLSISSIGVSIASSAYTKSDPEYSNKLARIALGLDIAALALDVAAIGVGVAKSAAKWTARRVMTKTWGGTMLNFNPIDREVFLFDDIYKGSRRLNIAGHGSNVGMHTSAGVIGPDDLASKLSLANVDFSNYSNIRLIMCHSGNGGTNSFAYRLHKITGKRVKGYVGPVTGNFAPEDMAQLVANFGLNDTIAVFSTKQSFVIKKTNPYNLFREPVNHFSFKYNPVHFP
ncbi:RHS repeat-associated core domain-containing protein [Burkholderia ubonensis]|uniref:RHS repeat-associated core domain-containing protein n=1 Tax=Burkholderia ubonensis TaxID=101571 RepID=UPI0009B497B8|nr:RHS repeat-associated core domain-containing protein [Burkholderia ubonensis]